jgi:hypothetical protein
MCSKPYRSAPYNGTLCTRGDAKKGPGCTLCQLQSDNRLSRKDASGHCTLIHCNTRYRLPATRSPTYDSFGGLVVSMLASGSRVRGFEPDLSMPSFGGEVK